MLQRFTHVLPLALAAALAVPAVAAARVSLVPPAPVAAQGENASLTVRVTPAKTICSIRVVYSTGPSKAKGLGRKRPVNGRVNWRWKVGSNTRPGRWPIIVDCGKSGKLRTYVRVVRR